MIVDELDSSASKTTAAVVSRTISSGDPHTDTKIWEKTVEEKSKGRLEGPLDVSVHGLFCDVSISRRFGVGAGT